MLLIHKTYSEIIRLYGVPHLGSVRGLSVTRKLGRCYGWFGVKTIEPLSLCLAEEQSGLRHGNFSAPRSSGPTQTIVECVMLRCI